MDFVLVGALVLLLFAAIVQLALAMHVRSMLVDCAGQGARYAAQAGHVPLDGVARTTELIDATLSPAYSRDVVARRAVVDGVDQVEVEVTAPLPVLGLVGPTGLTVRGHALVEAP
ncbi:MAG: pilus assembly protein [Cellulomonas sp.]|nr:pilus assembly protein [Cellulomonas sp.]